MKNKNRSLVLTAAKNQLASHPNTSPAALDILAAQESPELLERVAENPQTAPATLEKLAGHDEAGVRGAVSENKNVSPEMLHTLAEDQNPDVRYRLAENAQTPVDVLETLATDENPYVVDRAQETLAKVKSVAERADEMLLEENFAQAEELYRQLAHRLEELLGPQHHEIAKALHKLAAVLISQENLEEARNIEDRANSIDSAERKEG
jgi:hypothetical protein